MKSFLEDFYLKSPAMLQNIAVSIYGIKLKNIRYSGKYKDYFKKVNSHLSFNKIELKNYIESTLINTINNAVENVPYYRELFQRNSISPNAIQSSSDLSKIPLLEKDKVRQNSLQFVNEKYNFKKLQCIHTTGTTGTPLKIYCNSDTRQMNFAFFDRFLKQSGIDYTGKRATIWGRNIVSAKQMKPPFWRNSYFQKNMLFSSYHLTKKNIPEYIKKLNNYKPKYIDAYPSSLFAIADFALKQDISLLNITKGLTTSAETLFPEQRETIEAAFGVPVFDQYGAAEMCVFVGQCREGNYHIHTDYSILEFLKNDGTPADPGEEAELVCTSLINSVMPLIRYRIGDRGILSNLSCRCGSPFPVMEKILGRMDDVIITPDGKRVGRLSPVLKGFPIKEAQYIQKANGNLTVLLVANDEYSKITEDGISQELRKKLGQQIVIKYKYVDAINRGCGGKLKTIISHYHHGD